MNNHFPTLAYKLIKHNGYPLDKDTFEIELNMHPEFPSLSALDDVLSIHKIPHLCTKIDKKKIAEIDHDFLIFMNEQPLLAKNVDRGSLELLDLNLVPSSIHIDDLANELIVMIVQPIKKRLISILSDINTRASVWLIILLSVFLIAKYQSNLVSLCFVMVTFVSLTISFYIYMTNHGHSYTLINKICGDNQNKCLSVLNSKYAYIYGNIKLTDILLVGQGAILLYSLLVDTVIPDGILSIAVLSSIPLLIYSVYSQWTLKRWCKLCLTILFLSILQISIVLHKSTYFSPYLSFFTFLLIAIITILLWLSYSNNISKSKLVNPLYADLIGLKWNPHLFIGYLNGRPALDMSKISSEFPIKEFARGYFDSTIVLQPYCPSCEHMWHMVHELQADLHCFKSIRVVFYIKDVIGQKDDLQAAHYFINAFAENRGGWYDKFDQWIRNKNPLYVTNMQKGILENLQDIVAWCQAHRLNKTPLLLIGNKPIPYEYSPSDIRILLGILINEFEKQNYSHQDKLEYEDINARL